MSGRGTWYIVLRNQLPPTTLQMTALVGGILVSGLFYRLLSSSCPEILNYYGPIVEPVRSKSYEVHFVQSGVMTASPIGLSSSQIELLKGTTEPTAPLLAIYWFRRLSWSFHSLALGCPELVLLSCPSTSIHCCKICTNPSIWPKVLPACRQILTRSNPSGTVGGTIARTM